MNSEEKITRAFSTNFVEQKTKKILTSALIDFFFGSNKELSYVEKQSNVSKFVRTSC